MQQRNNRMNKYYSKLPPLLLVLGAVLRISGTGASAIWFDEANTLYRTSIPFFTLFTEQSENSGDLLLELVLRPLMAISHSLWLLRLPSMLAGLVSLWLVYKLMQRLDFNLPQQCLTAALVAFLPGLIWIAQDARSYGLLALVVLAAFWYVLGGKWIGVVATCGLMIYCHSTGPIYAAAILMIALYLYPRKYKQIIWSGIAIAMTWAPAIVRILEHWMIQQPWAPILTPAILINSILAGMWTASIFIWPWFAIAILITLAFTLTLLISKNKSSIQITLIAAWVYPFAGLSIFSLITNNMVQYRTLMPMLFPFCLWLGWELGLMRKPFAFRTILGGVWIFLLLVGLVFWDPSARGGKLDQVAVQIREQWRPGDVLVYATQTVALPFDYYLNDLPHENTDIVKHPFLNVPLVAPSPRPCNGSCLREWVIIPDDMLITPMERNELGKIIRGYPVMYQIKYLQAAKIDIYLVDGK